MNPFLADLAPPQAGLLKNLKFVIARPAGGGLAKTLGDFFNTRWLAWAPGAKGFGL